ncbi:hypothetical protein AX17_003784 [Amanita inopinata Kibby_2008]|nr:hypothetical protein AX17_003784 [Amanita inopinata Kibby_2008]
MSLLSLFHRHALQTPDSVFLVEDHDKQLSYKETYILVNNLIPTRLCSLCPALRSRPRPRVILLSPNNPLLLLSILSLWSLSAAVVLINGKVDPSLWAGMVRLIAPDLVLVAPEYKDQLLSSLTALEPSERPSHLLDLQSIVPQEYVSADNLGAAQSGYICPCMRWIQTHSSNTNTRDIQSSIDSARCDVDSDAIGLFTSSAVDWSTLKCVMYSHRVLYASSLRMIEALGGAYSSEPKRHLGWMSLSHCFEFCFSFCSIVLQTGGSYVFHNALVSSSSELPPSTPLGSLLLDSLAYHWPVSSFCSVPSIMESLVDLCSAKHIELLQNLRSLVAGGAPSSPDLLSWAAKHGISYYDVSGATEVAGAIGIRSALEPRQRLSGAQVINGLAGILRKEKQDDDRGELVLRGYDLPRGYESLENCAYHYDDQTKMTTYHTGDLYAHDPAIPVLTYVGEVPPSYIPNDKPLSGLTYLGRIDDMVVLKSGFKLNALEIEDRLNRQSAVMRSAITANVSQDALVALIELKQDTPSNRAAITSLIMDMNVTLSYEKRFHPENILFVKELPVTIKGTLNRKKLNRTKAKFLAKPNNHESPPFPPPLENGNLPRTQVISVLARVLYLPENHIAKFSNSLFSLPLTSLMAVSLANALKTEFSVKINVVHLYGIHTLDELCLLLEKLQQMKASNSIKRVKIAPDSFPPAAREDYDIAISGVSCRFVGGIDSLGSMWKALTNPDEFLANLSRERPSSRWEREESTEQAIRPMGWLGDDIAHDTLSLADFFGLTPRDVEAMNPNARLALKLGYEAIEDAGIAPMSLSGKPWAIFTCVNNSGWDEKRKQSLDLPEYVEGFAANADDAIGARLSYFLNLTGPVLEVKTACSSSAVATHQACNAIRLGDCEAAIVIASVTHFSPSGAMFRASRGMVSEKGISSAYSNHTDGYVASEGAAAIVLQRTDLSESVPYGIMKATAVTQDGRSRGFFAPNPQAQKRLLEMALAKSGLLPDDISYMEGHGSGTPLGDAIELQSLLDVYGSQRKEALYLGAIKSVIGHTEECAGLAGVLKALCCFQNNAIPPQPLIKGLNKNIDFTTAKICIPQRTISLLPSTDPRVIGVSLFGLTGTLAQVIIQEPPVVNSRPVKHEIDRYIFVISARRVPDFTMLCKRYLRHLANQPIIDIESFCRTSQIGRDHYAVRRSWIVEGRHELLSHLQQACSQAVPSPVTPPSIGIWFGLPLADGNLGLLHDHTHFKELFHFQDLGWAQQYEYFQRQFTIATWLKLLGCHVTAVGGEGLSEAVAAAYSGIFEPQAIFHGSVEPCETKPRIIVTCEESRLEQHLLSWRHDELHILFRHGLNVFTLQGTREAIEAMTSQHGLACQAEKALCHASFVSKNIRPPSIPTVSSYLGDVLDERNSCNINYWAGIHTRESNSLPAWKSLKSNCDFIINLGDTLGIEEVLGDECLSVRKLTFEEIVCRLFDLGVDLNWRLVCPDGERSHMPTHPWITDSDSIE